MAESTLQLTSRSVNKRSRVKREYDKCQFWDMKTGSCDSDGVSTVRYTSGGIKYSYWVCAKHYNKKRRLIYGVCSYRVRREDGTLYNCTSIRDTNRGKGPKKRGFCRRHEDQYLKEAKPGAVQGALDRLAGIITSDSFTGCWLTPAKKSSTNGRAQIGCAGLTWTTYRLAYVHFFGPHAKGLELSHSCDRKLCCNPLHVIPMTKKKHEVLTRDEQARNIWRIAQANREAPVGLLAFAETHGLPLYGTGTRFANAFFGTDYLLTDKRVARAV